ncbi:hypothetical protein ONS95_009381 [Cadophora gregata]|uniref:uncharacterized protein n=1 Tax=Cadophora gregata TaxID=51156 RepID=UPI0026DCFBBB|nr:uncharacterized protein ONS95_009381 [Cadophora gregata]KAK0124421.1 hypothetical protein ONS95_009381 [Cadophora gregata]KAK0129723.1 hypothetical protein ONS96_000283 [Cadophora gregata f. sp. sojae]
MSKRNIISVQQAELPVAKKSCTTQTSQKAAKLDQIRISSHPISFFGKTIKRGLSSEQEQASFKIHYTCPKEQTTATTKEKASAVGRQFSMDQLLDQWFGSDRDKRKSLRFTGFRPVQQPVAKKYDTGSNKTTTLTNNKTTALNNNKTTTLNNNKTTTVSDIPRPKTTRKKTVKQAFTIFEDDTGTETTNPTPDDIKNDPAFQNFGSTEQITSSTTYIRRGTKTVMQLASWKYASYVTEWLSPLTAHLDALGTESDSGFVERLCTWRDRIEKVREYGVTHPKGVRYGTLQHTHHDNEEEWFTVEDVEELAKIMEDMHQFIVLHQLGDLLKEGAVLQVHEHCSKTLTMIAGYCLTFGGGLDVGGPIEMGYLEDGRRNPEFFRRLVAAWSRIVELYLDEDLENHWNGTNGMHVWWIRRLRKRIGGFGVDDFIDWEVMENFWGDSYPPCEHVRRFGGRVIVAKEDPYAEERFRMGIDEFFYV